MFEGRYDAPNTYRACAPFAISCDSRRCLRAVTPSLLELARIGDNRSSIDQGITYGNICETRLKLAYIRERIGEERECTSHGVALFRFFGSLILRKTKHSQGVHRECGQGVERSSRDSLVA